MLDNRIWRTDLHSPLLQAQPDRDTKDWEHEIFSTFFANRSDTARQSSVNTRTVMTASCHCSSWRCRIFCKWFFKKHLVGKYSINMDSIKSTSLCMLMVLANVMPGFDCWFNLGTTPVDRANGARWFLVLSKSSNTCKGLCDLWFWINSATYIVVGVLTYGMLVSIGFIGSSRLR